MELPAKKMEVWVIFVSSKFFDQSQYSWNLGYSVIISARVFNPIASTLLASGRDKVMWDLLDFLGKRKVNEIPKGEKAWGSGPAARQAWETKATVPADSSIAG